MTSAYLGTLGVVFATHFHVVPHLAFLVVLFGWTLSLYIASRARTKPPPQKRYPLFAQFVFGSVLLGSVGSVFLEAPADFEPAHNVQTYAFAFASLTFGFGMLASFWVAADAFLKAETGKPWIANTKTTGDTMQLILLLPVGIWFLHPRIKRLLHENEAIA